jgi:hypothetical protein
MKRSCLEPSARALMSTRRSVRLAFFPLVRAPVVRGHSLMASVSHIDGLPAFSSNIRGFSLVFWGRSMFLDHPLSSLSSSPSWHHRWKTLMNVAWYKGTSSSRNLQDKGDVNNMRNGEAISVVLFHLLYQSDLLPSEVQEFAARICPIIDELVQSA